MKLTQEARAELKRREGRSTTGKRRVKKTPRTAVLVQAIEKKRVTRGTFRALAAMKVPR